MVQIHLPLPVMPYKDPKLRAEYHKKYMKEIWYPKNKEKHQAAVARTKEARKQKNKDKINKIKLSNGCVDCGYNKHPEALDFDHISDNKTMNVSKMMTHSWKEIQKEINKCEVVCANCHRIRTADRR